MNGEIIHAHSFILISTIESLHGKCPGLKIRLSLFVVTTFRRVSLVEQLACSTAEGCSIRVSVHGKFQLLVSEFKQTWNELRNFSHDPNIIFHENVLRISRVVT
jgi:hypothetical protein